MGQTTFEKGVEKGLQEGQLKMLVKIIETRFGPLTRGARERLAGSPSEQLEKIGEAMATAQSLRELGLEE